MVIVQMTHKKLVRCTINKEYNTGVVRQIQGTL